MLLPYFPDRLLKCLEEVILGKETDREELPQILLLAKHKKVFNLL